MYYNHCSPTIVAQPTMFSNMLSNEFIRTRVDLLDMSKVARSQVLSADMLEDVFGMLDNSTLHWIAHNYPMNEELAELFIRRCPIDIIRHRISQCASLSDKFVDRNLKYLNWDLVSESGFINSDSRILRYADYINWTRLSKHMEFQEWILIYFADRINWNHVIKNSVLSPEMLQCMHKKEIWTSMDWNYACIYQKLPENIIEERKDKLSWVIVCKHQKLSPQFMTRNHQYINWTTACKYQSITWPLYQMFKADVVMNNNNLKKDIEKWSKMASIDAKMGRSIWA